MIFYLSAFLSVFINVYAAWEVDCNNHCFFNDIQPNCQGVYWKYPDGSKGYSSWNNNQKGCLETNQAMLTSHIISLNQIQCGCPSPKTTPPADKSTPITQATKEKLELLRAQVHAWTYCSPDPTAKYANVLRPFTHEDIGVCQQWRKRKLPRNHLSVSGCFTGQLPFVGEELGGGCNYMGDQLANTVSACLVGNKDSCDQIKQSQHPMSGAWFRNPYMRFHPETARFQPSFSRDQMMGMLAYISKSKDKQALLKWLRFVKSNPKVSWGGAMKYSLCAPRPNIPKPAGLTQAEWDGQIPDDRCAIIPEAWGQIYNLALHIGISKSELSSIDAGIYNALISGSLGLDETLILEAATAPALGSAAYQIAGIFDALAVRYYSGGNNSKVRSGFSIVNSRTSKLNPLYHFYAEGKGTEYGAYLIRKYCSAPKPKWGFWFSQGTLGWPQDADFGKWWQGHTYLYGAYQFAGGLDPYNRVVLPDGNDCLTLLNLYLGNTKLTELKCEQGDLLINGACLRHPFPQPTLVNSLSAMDYKLNALTANLSYRAIDQSRCPFGGKLNVNVYPRECEMSSGLSPSDLNPSITYFVDPNIPGIFYNSNGSCHSGGQPFGSRCVVKVYPRPSLKHNVSYWVDPNPSWPGVYYSQVNGSCPHGGVVAGPNCQILSFPTGKLNPSRSYFTRSNESSPGVYYYPEVIPEKAIDYREAGNDSYSEEVRYMGTVIKAAVPFPTQKTMNPRQKADSDDLD